MKKMKGGFKGGGCLDLGDFGVEKQQDSFLSNSFPSSLFNTAARFQSVISI